MNDPRLARPLWRGRTNVDALTIACIERAEALVRERRPSIAHSFVVTQGSYQGDAGDPDSGTTHRLGGAVDLRWCGHHVCYWALRAAGMFIWHRTPGQGPWPDHFHGAPLDHPFMDSRLAAQQRSYLGGGNGLLGPDDGPRLHPIPRPVWPWPPREERDPMADYEKQLDRIERKQDRILARLAATAAIRTRLARLVKQGKATREDLQDLDDRLAAIEEGEGA